MLVVVGFTCGWWWRAMLGYGGGRLCCVSMYGGVLLKVLSFFFPLFCRGFWIWNLLEDPVIVVVVVAVVVGVVLGWW